METKTRKKGYFRGKCTFFEKKLRNVLLVSEKFIPLHSQNANNGCSKQPNGVKQKT